MRPKNPTPRLPDTPTPTSDTSHPLPIPRLELPGLIRPGAPGPSQPSQPLVTLPPSGSTVPTIQIHDLIPSFRASEEGSSSDPNPTGSIRHYELPPLTRTLLPGVNSEGLRVHKGRIYAEVQYTTTTTVMVAWDEGLGTYRAMHPQELHPSGPALHFDSDSNTWRVGERQVSGHSVDSVIHRQNADDNMVQTYLPQTERPSRAQSDTAVTYIDVRHYVWDKAASNHHGYVLMHRKMRLDDSVGPVSQHAFMDDNGLFASVEPPTYPIDQPAEFLPAWTDRDIWSLYGLQGADIARFRAEAHRTGRKPQWAKVRAQRMENTFLYDELRRWLGPNMDRNMFNRVLEYQKLTPAKWAEHLDSVTLHRDTPGQQTPLPDLPEPDSSLPRLPTPDMPAITDTMPTYGYQSHHTPDPDSPSRSSTESQTSSPRLPKTNSPETRDTTPTRGDKHHYTWDIDKADYHGYIEMQRKPGLDDSHGPLTQVAFREGTELTIVKPIRYTSDQRAFLPNWRDIDIWNLYRIEGEDLLRFRVEAALNRKPPAWVKQREYPSRREQLIDYLRLWTSPDSPLKSREQVIARFQPYNLSTRQLAQLCGEISPTGRFNNLINDELPTWARTHQDRTRRVSNPKLFDQLLPEIQAEIIRLRNQGGGTSILKASLTEPFFQQLLVHAGFKRNKHNFLYRVDIPAMFKVDDRPPFEIARPGALLPQKASTEGSTSGATVSALFSLGTAMSFANEITPLRHPPELHQNSEAAARPTQRIRFCYLLDTRNVEVVPGQDNRAYNPTRISQKPAGDKTWFPTMKMEGHVSISSIGLTSRRVWLVNTSMTRAATVDDIHTQALERATGSNQNHADDIEARTRSGALNRNEYDALIDEAANAGKRILELPEGKDIFSNDIVFPLETITL